MGKPLSEINSMFFEWLENDNEDYASMFTGKEIHNMKAAFIAGYIRREKDAEQETKDSIY